MYDKFISYQITKFLVVGTSNTIISFVVFSVFYNFIIINNAFLSQCIGYTAGIVWSFVWNKGWTFSEKKHSWLAFLPFLIIQISLLLFSALSIDITSQTINWNINIIWLCVTLITTIINFSLSKYLVFRV